MPAAVQEALDRHLLAKRVLGAQCSEVLPQLLELPSLAELRKRLASDFRAAQRDGIARRDVDPDQLAMGLETIVLALLMAGVHVPQDLDRAIS